MNDFEWILESITQIELKKFTLRRILNNYIHYKNNNKKITFQYLPKYFNNYRSIRNNYEIFLEYLYLKIIIKKIAFRSNYGSIHNNYEVYKHYEVLWTIIGSTLKQLRKYFVTTTEVFLEYLYLKTLWNNLWKN